MNTESSTSIPLAVDLDGTLIRSDMLLETFVLLIKRNPLYLFLIPLWLLRGKAALKAEIASRVIFNPAALPYVQPLIDWLRSQRQRGRAVWLCTASDRRLAQAVADHLQIFDGALGSDGQFNMSGSNKARVLVERFGEQGFDYCGNHFADRNVWRHARAAVVVNGGGRLEALVRADGTPVEAIFAHPGGQIKAAIKAMRPHQWAKNALIVVPVAAGHKMGDAQTLLHAVCAFLSFSLCASSVYLLNDLLDLEADRQHHSKSHRPFASGQAGISFGLFAIPMLLLASLGLASFLPPAFMTVLAVYYVGTLAYSFGLKRIVMVDVLALAGLYTVRVVAGGAATGIELSFWLLMFSVFSFLNLAMVKRYAELYAMRRQGKLKVQGRGYEVEDLHLLQSLGPASGYISVLVLALYVNSPDIAHTYSTHAGSGWLCR